MDSRKKNEDYVEQAYLGIRKMFFLNEISPGQKIGYGELAKRLGMSTTPVIQALKRLDVQGLVRYEPNRGYFTAEISLEEIQEIYDFRESIEVNLLEKSIEGLDAGKIDRLAKSLARHGQAVAGGDLSQRLLADRDYHLLLAEFSGSTIQLSTLKTLFDLLYLKYRGAIIFDNPVEGAQDDHQVLFDCVVARDLQRAQKVLRNHIARIRQHAVGCIVKREQARTLRNL